MVVHVDKLKHYKRDDVKSWLLLPNVVPGVAKETNDSQDPIKSTVVDPGLQVFPVEESSDVVTQMPMESTGTNSSKDADETSLSPGETEMFPNRRSERNRRKPARYRD